MSKPISDRNMPSLKAEVKDNTEVQESFGALEKFMEEYHKEKKPLKVENEIRGELISLATKLGENPALQ